MGRCRDWRSTSRRSRRRPKAYRPLFYLDIATTVALWAVIRLILRRQAV
jgi:hypothetical protein